MKQESDKGKKQRQPLVGKAEKPMCGTLSYLAECRRALHKTASDRGAGPPVGVNRTIRT